MTEIKLPIKKVTKEILKVTKDLPTGQFDLMFALNLIVSSKILTDAVQKSPQQLSMIAYEIANYDGTE
jgi:hypothetical protein|tara:strand:- start:1223 stop:1426 length:204 start_codon:yes stop_codon:yes gene_type:complete